MPSQRVKNLNLSFEARHAPTRGPTDPDRWNDTVDEIAFDLSALSDQWNNRLVKVLSTVPNGDDNSAIDAFSLGMDGANLWVDSTVTASSDDLTYYTTEDEGRPITLKEALDDLRELITQNFNTLNTSIENVASTGTTSGSTGDVDLSAYATIAQLDSYTLTSTFATYINTASGVFTGQSLQIDTGDLVVTNSDRGIVLQSPDGTNWRITIDNAGALSSNSL